MARAEQDFLEEETVQLQLLEKQLADEERKLQQRKDQLLKLKQAQNEAIERARDQRKHMFTVFQGDEQRAKIQERHSREELVKAKKELEATNQKRAARNRMMEVEMT